MLAKGRMSSCASIRTALCINLQQRPRCIWHHVRAADYPQENFQVPPLQERSNVKQLTAKLQAAQLCISELEAQLNQVSLHC